MVWVVRSGVPLCAPAFSCAPLCSPVRPCVLLCAPVFSCAPLCSPVRAVKCPVSLAALFCCDPMAFALGQHPPQWAPPAARPTQHPCVWVLAAMGMLSLTLALTSRPTEASVQHRLLRPVSRHVRPGVTAPTARRPHVQSPIRQIPGTEGAVPPPQASAHRPLVSAPEPRSPTAGPFGALGAAAALAGACACALRWLLRGRPSFAPHEARLVAMATATGERAAAAAAQAADQAAVSFTFVAELSPRAYEVEADGTLGLAGCADLLQEVAWRHAEAVNLGSLTEGLIPVLSKLRVEARAARRPKWGEPVRVETWFAQDGRLAARRDWRILAGPRRDAPREEKC